MLTQNDQLRNTLHVVLNVDDNVDTEKKVFAFKGELFVSVKGVLVDLVYVLIEISKLLNELAKDRLVKSLLELGQKLFHTFGLNGVSGQFIVYVLSVLS